MRQFIFKSSHLLLGLFLLIAVASCSSDDNGSGSFSGGNSFSMKIDGNHWSSSINTLFTEDMSNANGEYYFVTIGGVITDEADDPTTESLQIYIAIPASKLNNPKGIYQVNSDADMSIGQASATFTSSNSENYLLYTSTPHTLGTLEITGFELGEQTVMGHPTGQMGYTQLKGTFNMELASVSDPSVVLTITDGQFNLSSGLGFDFKN